MKWFWAILAPVAWPRAQPLGQSISLKFSMETRLESEYFEPLINFLTLLVQKLWSKINKSINYLINYSKIFTNLDHNFWTRSLSRSSKVSKDLDCSLESNKNFSEILKWPQNYFTYDVSHKKSTPPNQKIFLVQTTRLAASFGPLHSSLPLSAPELSARKALCNPVVLVWTAWFRPASKVLTI